jgi:hypothetical protein
VRRNRLAFVSGTSVVLALIGGLTVASFGLTRERSARTRAEQAESEQRRLRTDAEVARNSETALRQRAEAGERLARRSAYAAEVNVAFEALGEGNLGRARELLERQRPKPGKNCAALVASPLGTLPAPNLRPSTMSRRSFGIFARGELFAMATSALLSAASPRIVGLLRTGFYLVLLSYSPCLPPQTTQ